MVWIDVLCLCLLLYLGEADSHLLLSWAGLGCCDTAHDIGQTQLRLSLFWASKEWLFLSETNTFRETYGRCDRRQLLRTVRPSSTQLCVFLSDACSIALE